MKRKKNRWRPLPLFFPNHPKISRRRKRRTRARMRTCHRSSERKFTLCCYFLIFDRDPRGEFGNDFISLCALIYARLMKNSFHKKRSHFGGGNRRRHHFLVFYQRRRTQPVRRQRRRQKRERNDVRRVDAENGQRSHRVLFALFQRRRVLLRGDAREEKIR